MRSLNFSGKWITFLRELITEDRDAKLQPSIRIKTSVGGKHEKIALRRPMMGAFDQLQRFKRKECKYVTFMDLCIHLYELGGPFSLVTQLNNLCIDHSDRKERQNAARHNSRTQLPYCDRHCIKSRTHT